MTNQMTTRVGTSCLNRALLALLCIGLLTSHGNSQTANSATLRFNVVDTLGSAVPGATVALKREGTGEEISQVTTADGTVTFLNPRPGNVTVTVKATKFATLQQDVTVSENQSSEFTLSIGPPIHAKLDSLRPGLAARFARGFQYQYQLNEQPETVFISQGSGVGEVTAFLRNRQDYLQQHTLTFKFSELFPDRLSTYKRGSDYLKKHPEAADGELSETICGRKPLITCLAFGGSWWQRTLMGTSISASLAQRARVQQGVIVPFPTFGKKYQFSGGFVFDPAKLFPTATNWKTTFDDVQSIDKALALVGTSDVQRQPWRQPWAAVIPKVEFKMITQFDFLKYNGALIEAPFPERALNTWTFTWDLTRAIPDTKNRIDEDAIHDGLHDLKSSLGRKEEKWTKWCRLKLANEVRDIEDVHPASSAQSCQRVAQIMNAEKYQLLCVLKDKDGKEKDRKNGAETDPSMGPVKPDPNRCNW